ncbi:ESX secretion-associated protein EspG [Mycobacterium neglectum]|uniref:ESX secretion-associated protein EspG n=1 Tax=Mycobacterium neglectum TaxID=242737 RepID=UPI000BFED0CF|nr:ESX secretion-associated protein EspG [Mycobacterium neglectum]
MNSTLTTHFVLTEDEVQVVASRVDVQALPVVLAVRPRHGTDTAHNAAVDHATRALTGRGLIHNGEVTPDLVALLRALQRPDRELAMRLVTPDGIARVSVICSGAQCISARRIEDEIVFEVAEGQPSLTLAARVLLAHLPSAPAAEIAAVGAPLDTASEALSGTNDATELSDRIRTFGAEPRTAMLLGSALASRQAFAEIVYYALDGDEDRISRCPAAVGVFYTKRGRIVAGPSASPVGQLWTTLKGGSDHAIGQAIGALVELSGGWGDF